MEDSFSTDWGGGWFRDGSSALHFPCTLFLLLLHQFHLRSCNISSWKLGDPCLKRQKSGRGNSDEDVKSELDFWLCELLLVSCT